MTRTRALIIAIVIGAAVAGCAKQQQQSDQTATTQVNGTWTLMQNGVSTQGLFYALGPHRGTFNPCNSTQYIAVSPADLQPNAAPCGAPDPGSGNIQPDFGIIGSKPFQGSSPGVNARVLNVILASPDSKTTSVVSKINSGTISSIDDLKKDPTFTGLPVKQ